MNSDKTIHIVGAGPSGLFCCFWLLNAGFKVVLFDRMPSAGRKFLIAGHSGLNLTHSENKGDFSFRYGDRKNIFKKLLDEFSPSDLIQWCRQLGVETFEGSSGRVFPTKMKAAEMLKLWMDKLQESDYFQFFTRHTLLSIDGNKLIFDAQVVEFETCILALGGASWSSTGSDGRWSEWLSKLSVEVEEFKPVNCGYLVEWPEYIKEIATQSEVQYLKNIKLSFEGHHARGDLVLTDYGIESGPIYALSVQFKDFPTQITIDLFPDKSQSELYERLSQRPNKQSMTNFLRKSLNLTGAKLELVKAYSTKEQMSDASQLSQILKAIEVELAGPRQIDEAISTGGGVRFETLNESFQSRANPGLYFVGEMLDWQAPTGGYLLQGCFSSAFHVAKSIISDPLD